MKKILIFSLSILITSQLMGQETAHSKHTEKAEKILTLNKGKKWEIDKILTENMNKIMTENKRLAVLARAKKVTKEDYNKLSDIITSSAETIVNKCKLEPKADEAFHHILSDLYIVSDYLKDSKKPEDVIEKLDSTLNSYLKYFNHPVTK